MTKRTGRKVVKTSAPRRRLSRVAVTGGSGKAGVFVVRELLEHGYDVLNLDLKPPASAGGRFLTTHLTDYGEAVDALSGCEAVVHLAAIPNDCSRPPAATFNENVASTFNVFQAARLHRMKRIVWASSETVLGLPYRDPEPVFAPLDETHPDLPNSTYSLSKAAGETMATHFARWTGVPIVGLRFSNVMHPDDYALFPSWQDDPQKRSWNLWGYIDGRDTALSCRLGLEAAVEGAPVYIIAAKDTVMLRPSTALMAEVFPKVKLRRRLRGRESIFSIEKARRELGFEPQYSWCDATG